MCAPPPPLPPHQPPLSCVWMRLNDVTRCSQMSACISCFERDAAAFCSGWNITEKLLARCFIHSAFFFWFSITAFFFFFLGDSFFFFLPAGKRMTVCNRARYLHSGLFSTSFIISRQQMAFEEAGSYSKRLFNPANNLNDKGATCRGRRGQRACAWKTSFVGVSVFYTQNSKILDSSLFKLKSDISVRAKIRNFKFLSNAAALCAARLPS